MASRIGVSRRVPNELFIKVSFGGGFCGVVSVWSVVECVWNVVECGENVVEFVECGGIFVRMYRVPVFPLWESLGCVVVEFCGEMRIF